MEGSNGVIKVLGPDDRSYYTAKEVAQMIGCSESHAYKICKQVKDELINRGILMQWYLPGRVPKQQFRKMIGLDS